MNEIYQTPLFTTWPMPVDFTECFGYKTKTLRNKAKNETRRVVRAPFSLNLFSIFF
jgi:hypothetical protein